MFRSYDDTKANIEKYLARIGNTWANLFLHHAFHAFYVGLASFWLARKSRDGQQQQQQHQQWQERGKLFTLALKKWAESSHWTFENKWCLLEAEDAYCNNDFEAAKKYYGKAISSAKDHKVRYSRNNDLYRVVFRLLTLNAAIVLLVHQRRSFGL